MAVADADYRFLYFDVGAYGSEGDSGVFRNSSFGTALQAKKLQIPESTTINGVQIPYYFVADDAFPLSKNIMKPYKPPNKQSFVADDQRIFNYR